MEPDFTILYVDDLQKSMQFYADLLGTQAIPFSTSFAMFVPDSGTRLGLWKRSEVSPPPTPAGGTEMGFGVMSNAEVDRLHRQWAERRIAIVQTPCQLDYVGYTFVAADPDGHRLRIYCRPKR